MGDRTKIEWSQSTWSPVTGCTKVSPGCAHCYAETMSRRLSHNPRYATATKADATWSGVLSCHEDMLDQPLRWKKPRTIFVCSMSDLFHVKVPWEFIIKVFDVMAATPWHTYQVLTKRPGRMAHFAEHIWEPYTMEQNHSSHIWPRNVWAGTSVEMEWDGNKHLAKRLDCLARVPAQVSFLSAEPLLGPLDLRGWLPGWCQAGSTFENPRKTERWDIDGSPVNPLSWVIVGGESGPGARPMHPDWARSLRDQCQAARVPFFFKQWGEWMPAGERLAAEWLEDGVKSPLGWLWENGEWCYFGDGTRLDSKAGSPSLIHKTGKKAAGAVLDGREWREMPPERRE